MEEDNLDKAAEQEAGDGSKPRNGIRARWEKYKKEFAANQVSVYHVLELPHHSKHHVRAALYFSVAIAESVFGEIWLKPCTFSCSSKRCLTITANLHGLRKSMILRRK
jgi:hypothetical protein